MSNEPGLIPVFIISRVLIYLDFQFSQVKFLYMYAPGILILSTFPF